MKSEELRYVAPVAKKKEALWILCILKLSCFVVNVLPNIAGGRNEHT